MISLNLGVALLFLLEGWVGQSFFDSYILMVYFSENIGLKR